MENDELVEPTPGAPTWVELAPRATKFQIAGASVVTNAGPLPVLAFAYETLDGKLITVSLITTKEGAKETKRRFLRAYDEALREVAVIQRSIDADEEHDPL